MFHCTAKYRPGVCRELQLGGGLLEADGAAQVFAALLAVHGDHHLAWTRVLASQLLS